MVIECVIRAIETVFEIRLLVDVLLLEPDLQLSLY